MTQQFDYDYVVVGAGSGGIASANRAAMHGAKVAIIEADQVGGTCVNRGCVPKKVLWNGATLLKQIKEYAQDYGIDAQVKDFQFQQLVKERTAYIDRIHDSYSNGINNNGITYISGWGTLLDGHTVKVTAADGTTKQVTGKYLLLAPGGRPNLPTIPGAEYGINSDDFFKLQSLPESVVVVGAGYIAVELAGVLSAFGTKTILMTRGNRPLRWADHDVTDKLLEHLRADGIQHHGGMQINSVTKNNAGKLVVATNNGDFVTDTLIWAVGRHPNTGNLGLENTKVKLDNKGFIETTELNQTTEESIFAIGDATHMPALTPVAIAAGRRLAERLFNNKLGLHFDAKLIPTVIFSHPAIGVVGINEEDAIKQYGAYSDTNPQGVRIYKSSFTSMISAITSHRQNCFMKLVTQGPDEKVIGLHGIGYGVDEMIQGFAVAMNLGATKADFDNTVAIHPTGSEEFVTMR